MATPPLAGLGGPVEAALRVSCGRWPPIQTPPPRQQELVEILALRADGGFHAHAVLGCPPAAAGLGGRCLLQALDWGRVSRQQEVEPADPMKWQLASQATPGSETASPSAGGVPRRPQGAAQAQACGAGPLQGVLGLAVLCCMPSLPGPGQTRPPCQTLSGDSCPVPLQAPVLGWVRAK